MLSQKSKSSCAGCDYGVATISRLLKMLSLWQKSPIKETILCKRGAQRGTHAFTKVEIIFVRAVAACTQIIKKVLTTCVQVVQYFCIRVRVCVCVCACVYIKKRSWWFVCTQYNTWGTHACSYQWDLHTLHTHTHVHTAQRQTVSATPYTQHIRCPRARPDVSPQSLQAARESQQPPAPMPQHAARLQTQEIFLFLHAWYIRVQALNVTLLCPQYLFFLTCFIICLGQTHEPQTYSETHVLLCVSLFLSLSLSDCLSRSPTLFLSHLRFRSCFGSLTLTVAVALVLAFALARHVCLSRSLILARLSHPCLRSHSRCHPHFCSLQLSHSIYYCLSCARARALSLCLSLFLCILFTSLFSLAVCISLSVSLCSLDVCVSLSVSLFSLSVCVYLSVSPARALSVFQSRICECFLYLSVCLSQLH